MSQTYITLNNGNKIPQFGLGVYQVPQGEAIEIICDETLPEIYDRELFQEKCNNLYNHFYDHYNNYNDNTYNKVA